MQIIAKIDTQCFNKKPNKPQIACIRNRFKISSANMYSIEDFVDAVQNGRTFYPADAKGIRANDWKCQNLFGVDIDNVNKGKFLELDDILAICSSNDLKPLIIYETFNSKVEHHKYRVLFLCDETITNKTQRSTIITVLLKLFTQADIACKNADRIFFGTNKQICYLDNDATFSYRNDIIRILGKLIPKPIESNNEFIGTKKYLNGIDLNTEISKYDLLAYMQKECGEIVHESSNYIMFHYCPICKGHEDLVYYKDSNTFTCFGKNGQITGNIITFLSLTKNISKADAVKYFLYDLLNYDLNVQPRITPESTKYLNTNNEIKNIIEHFLSLKTHPEEYSQDDKGMGELFSRIVKNILRYNVDRKSWMYYNGKVWVNDTGSAKVNKYAKFFTDALLLYTFEDTFFENIEDEKQRSKAIDDYRKAINRLGAKNKRDSIIKDAESEFPIQNKDLDANTKLLNVQNGTFNLDTYEFKPHNSDDMNSMIANVEYDSNSSSEDFEKFLNEIFDGDLQKIKYLQKVMGYCLTVSTKEETFFILFGPTTRNGKSTYIEVFIFMLGDYAKQANPETFAIKKYSDSRTASGDIARLCGARIVNSTELPKGMMLDVARIKSLTGGDTITARGLYQSEFQFTPYFKLFLTTNHLPQVNDETLFTSNRVNVITFDRHFTPEEQDKNLKRKLRQKEVLSGILNWCIEGLKEYRAEGLEPPMCVVNANKDFQAQSDIVGIFLSENFERSEKNTKLQDAYNLYCNWCNEQGYYAGSKADFNEILRKRGLTATVNGIRNLLKGLVVKSDAVF